MSVERPRKEYPIEWTWDLSQAYPSGRRQADCSTVRAAIEDIEHLLDSEGTINLDAALASGARVRNAGSLIDRLLEHAELNWLVDTSAEQGEAWLKEAQDFALRGHRAQVDLMRRIEEEGNLAEMLIRVGMSLGQDRARLTSVVGASDLSQLKFRGQASLQDHQQQFNRGEAITAAASLASTMRRSTLAFEQDLASADPERRLRAYRLRIAQAEANQERVAEIFNMLAKSLQAEARQSGESGASIMRHKMAASGMPPELFRLMTDAAHARTAVFDRLHRKRKEALGLRQLRHCDIALPREDYFDTKRSEIEAIEIVAKCCAVIHRKYSSAVRKYLDPAARLVDWPNNLGKQRAPISRTLGGFSFLSIAFDGSHHALLELSRGVSYSLHQIAAVGLSKTGPDQFAREVAGAVNEVLLTLYFVSTAPTPGHAEFYRREALHLWMERMFEQSFTAEFELRAYELFEANGGVGVTAQQLGALYLTLSRQYFGGTIVFDDDEACLWINALPLSDWNPCSGYLYPCAMAMALAIGKALYAAVGNPIRKSVAAAYLNFLVAGAGSSKPTAALFAELGWPLTEPTWFEVAFKTIEEFMSKVGD